jgi:8-oxo-dGTP pyrophosphatase MutT (NUDIX family)
VTSASPSQPLLVPKDAATLILIDRTAGHPRVLMGRRRPELAFMANMFVFPGGRVDVADETAPSADELAPFVAEKLMVSVSGPASLARARGFGIAAIRETYEETGLALGAPQLPALGALRLLARAITPPERPRRFDTRFFIADAVHLSSRQIAGDGELLELSWFTLDEARGLELPAITKVILDDVGHALAAGGQAPIPFYSFHEGRRVRAEL